MNSTATSIFKAQLSLGRLIGMAVIITLCCAFTSVLGSGFPVSYLFILLLTCMVPPAATFALLLNGHRRLASYVSLLGTIPCTALVMPMLLSVIAYPALSLGWIERVVTMLPFIYSSVTLARVGVRVRVTAAEQSQARLKLRAARRAVAEIEGPAYEQ